MFNFHRFNFITPKASRLLGLDIGSSFIKLLELSHSQNQYCIESWAITAIENSIPAAIELAIEQSGTHQSSAAIAISDNHVISKIISIDENLSIDDAEELIVADAEKYFHYPANEISIDFDIQGPSKTHPGHNDVFLVAARTEHIHEHVALVNEAGLNVSVVDVRSLALNRACHFFISSQSSFDFSKSPVLTLDIENKNISMMVTYERSIIFFRTESIEENGNHSILAAIQRTLHFFKASHPHLEVMLILLMGEGCYRENIGSLIEKQFGVLTLITNPLSELLMASHIQKDTVIKNGCMMMACLGLALRNFQS